MGKSSRGKRDVVAARLARKQAGHNAFDDSPVQEAHRILAALDSRERSYRMTYYVVQPEQLSENLDVPIDGKLHIQSQILGKTIHLEESARRDSVTGASRAFTGPFIAVLRRPEHVAAPVGHATVVHGANLASEMLLGSLQVIQVARRIERLHFASMLGLSTKAGEWTASGRDEMQQIVADFQLCVEAEAVIVAGGHMTDL